MSVAVLTRRTAGVGLAGGWLLGLASSRRSIAGAFQKIAVVALPLLCLEVSKMIGASMFIAAFVAGLAVQIGFKEAGKHSVEFVEEWGRLLNLGYFSFSVWSSFERSRS